MAPSAVNSGALDAFFLDAGAGRSGARWCVHHVPAGPVRGAFVFAHGWAEEMNKSRRMVALQARAWAARGIATLTIDLTGCGDSTGALVDATWDDWLLDLAEGVRWMEARHGVTTGLWGLRAGALLAAQAAARLGPRPLVMWQPPAKGAPLLQQFLRLKMAGELASGGARGVTEGLKQALARGDAVDVAGYTVPAALARGLEAATLEAATPPPGTPVAWLEVVAPSTAASQAPAPTPSPAPSLLPVSESLTARWRAAGVSLHAQAVPGPGFWQTTEIETAPALVDATLRATADWVAAPPPPSAGAAPAGGGEPVAAPLPGCVETPLLFPCQGQRLVGVLGTPRPDTGPPRPAVLIVVGGPQVRAGSHRQFVGLARALAAAGHPVLRFDVRGMGDAEGEPRSFEALDDDLAAAVDALTQACPQAPGVLLWGLCDGASASLLYQRRRPDPRVKGLALANPWVRSAQSQARTHVKHYYLQRLGQRAFWAKLLRGGVGLQALSGLANSLRAARGRPAPAPNGGSAPADEPYPQAMARAWAAFPGPVLLLLSGQDYTAREFLEFAGASPAWAGLLQRPQVQRVDLPEADHTFSVPGSAQACEAATVRFASALNSTPRG